MTVSLQHAILIDNYDSYTYTIKDYFETLNVNVTVMTNDDPTLNRLEKLKPSFLILSPGIDGLNRYLALDTWCDIF